MDLVWAACGVDYVVCCGLGFNVYDFGIVGLSTNWGCFDCG